MSKKEQTPVFYVLEEDKQWARERIAELEKAIQDLGPEFNIALNQSNETWHDNAPFDALRDTQAIMVAEMQNLKETLFKASIASPKKTSYKVGIGSKITVKNAKGAQVYKLAGHWSPFAGVEHDSHIVVSCTSPLGTALLGSKRDQQVIIPTNKKVLGVIVDIS